MFTVDQAGKNEKFSIGERVTRYYPDDTYSQVRVIDVSGDVVIIRDGNTLQEFRLRSDGKHVTDKSRSAEVLPDTISHYNAAEANRKKESLARRILGFLGF